MAIAFPRVKMEYADQTAAWVALAQGNIEVRPATLAETDVVAAILREAAIWLEQRGMPLWQPSAFEPDRLATDVVGGRYMLARWRGSPAGVFRYQHEDPETGRLSHQRLVLAQHLHQAGHLTRHIPAQSAIRRSDQHSRARVLPPMYASLIRAIVVPPFRA